MRSFSIAILLATPLATALSFPPSWSRLLPRESVLERRNTTTIPAAIDIAPSQYWDGDDGPWSSFALQVGKQVQNIRVLLSTAGGNVVTISPDGCPAGFPSNCADERGGFFNVNKSATYIQNSIYDIGLGRALGLDTDANAGYDTVTLGWQGSNGPTAEHTVIFNLAVTSYWLGLFGLNPRPTNFTTYGDPITSFTQQLVNNNTIPSLSYGYTAGNQYRLNKVFGSLVLGGYDANRFQRTNITFPFDADISLDLSVNLKGITTGGGNTNLLPDGQIRVFLDSTVSQLYLPKSACQAFEDAFGLTWDDEWGYYLVNNSLHNTLLANNREVTFTIGPQVSGGDTINITLPYGAFDLQLNWPNIVNPNTSYYFPLQRAANDSQYIFGRTFFQEAYLIADYDRSNFTVAPCIWDQSKVSNASIVSILRANETQIGGNSNNSNISTGAIVGIVVGVVGGIIVILLGVLFWLRRKRHERKRIAELDAKKSSADNKDSSDTSKPFISNPIGGELAGDAEIHEMNAPYRPAAQEMDSPYKMDPSRAGYSEMSGGDHFAPLGKGGAQEVHGSTPIFEMPGSDVHEMPAREVRPAEKPPTAGDQV